MPLTPAEQQLVEIFEVTLPEMVRTNNIPGYVSLYTDDGAWFPDGATDRFGKEQIAAGVTELLAKESINPKFTAQEVWVQGRYGYVLGFSEQHVTPHDGNPKYIAYSRELWCFQRVEGEFKIIRLIFNNKENKAQLGTGPVSPCTIDSDEPGDAAIEKRDVSESRSRHRHRSHYNVIVDPDHLEIRVEWHFSGPEVYGDVRVEIPTWVPGDYTFFQLARDVFEVEARTADGSALHVERDGWQAWKIKDAEGDIVVTWRAWGYEIDFAEPSGIIDGAYAILLGARYLHSRRWLGPCTVHYHLPERWQGTLHHPSGAHRLDEETWEYPSFEILLDTPVSMGDLHILKRDVRGTLFSFVFVDKGIGFEEVADRFVDDVAATAATFFDMFGGFPFEDYSFVLTLNPAAEWGLEHLTSTMCGLGPDVFTDPDQYAIGVRVCAHELFHAWNVRRLRPSPLGELASHLTSGSFTKGLWVAEGFTRYYEFLSCTRTSVYTPQQFISAVVGYFSHLSVLPAYDRVSAADASLATYLNHSPKYPGRCNTCIDYYDKGMVIAFGLDARLRLAGDSLDAAFADFYRQYEGFGPGVPGYTMEDVLSFFNHRLDGLAEVLHREALEPGPLATIEVLESLGFEPCYKEGHMLGLMFLNSSEPEIYNVLDTSPAGHTGIAPQDVITGVNGYTYTRAGLFWAAQQAQPVELDVERGQRRLTFQITPEPVRRLDHLIWNGGPEQAEILFTWIGRSFELEPGQVFSLDFYENFHGIETVI